MVSGLSAEVGQVVAAGQTVLTFVESGEMEVEINVPENRLPIISVGKNVEVSFWAMANTKARGVIREIAPMDLYETFFYNTVHGAHRVNATERSAMFIVDNQYYFDVKEQVSIRDAIRPTAVGELELGRGNQMPLWLLGFLY